MRSPEPLRLRSGVFRITIETEGCLTLPPELVRPLGLEPGDIVPLKPLGDAVEIRFYRQILTFPLETLSPAIRWSFIVELQSLPLTALDERRTLWIPREIVHLRPGDRVVLSVSAMAGVSWPSVYLSGWS